MARFLTTSDGEIVANPRFLDATRERIADLQRRKARARPGSGNCRRLRRALAKEWRKVRYQRRDFHHKTARALVESNDAIALEDLHVDSLTASARGTVEVPGRNVAAKAGLNLNPPRLRALCGVLPGQEPFGIRRAVHLEGERPQRQKWASYQAKRVAPSATSVDSG